MTTFDAREKAFEDRFVYDENVKFRAHARSIKLLATWAATRMGTDGAARDEFVKSVLKTAGAEARDDDVIRKIKAAFWDKNVPLTEPEIRAKFEELTGVALQQVLSGE